MYDEELPKPKTRLKLPQKLVTVGLWGAAGLMAVVVLRTIFASPEPTELTVQSEPTESPVPTAETLVVSRQQAWDKLQADCRVSLLTAKADVDDELALGRGGKWAMQAKLEAQRTPSRDDFDWLSQAFLAYGSKVQAMSAGTGQIVTSAKTVRAYRDLSASLQDIAMAITTPPNAATRNAVPTMTLNNAIDQCRRSIEAYRGLRDDAANDARTKEQQQSEQTPAVKPAIEPGSDNGGTDNADNK